MNVIFEARDAEAHRMRDVSIDRLHAVLHRLENLASRARVQLSDVNGPRGGIDKRCRIEIKTDSAGTIVASSMAGDWRTALENSLATASQLLAKTAHRRRQTLRGRGAKNKPYDHPHD